MRARTSRYLLSILALVLGLTVHAGPAKRGWTKLELIETRQKPAAVPEELLSNHGGELVASYDAFSVVRVPEAAVHGLTKAANARGWAVRRRDDFDVLRLPRARIDTREGIRNAPFDGLAREYPPGRPG